MKIIDLGLPSRSWQPLRSAIS